MSKSYKIKDGNYLDSSSVVHNKKQLSELLNAKWRQATLNSDFFTAGTVQYIQIGNLVIINLNEVVINEDYFFSNSTTVLASGLPTNVTSGITLLNQGDGQNDSNSVRVRVLNGNILLHWTRVKKYSNGGISGTIIASAS